MSEVYKIFSVVRGGHIRPTLSPYKLLTFELPYWWLLTEHIMKMKKKNWDGCGSGDEVLIGFHKKVGNLTFTKDQWEYFKETVDWMFEVIDEGK